MKHPSAVRIQTARLLKFLAVERLSGRAVERLRVSWFSLVWEWAGTRRTRDDQVPCGANKSLSMGRAGA